MNSQHKVLLPARLTAAHSDGGALNILHLQGHVSVEFFCKKQTTIGYTTVYVKQVKKWVELPKIKTLPWGPSSLAFFTADTWRKQSVKQSVHVFKCYLLTFHTYHLNI